VSSQIPVNGICETGSIRLSIDYVKLILSYDNVMVGPQGVAGPPGDSIECSGCSPDICEEKRLEFVGDNFAEAYLLFLTKETTDDVKTAMIPCIYIQQDTVISYSIKIIVKQINDSATSAIFKIKGHARKGDISEFLNNEIITLYTNKSSLAVDITIDSDITVKVIGINETMQWFARAQIITV
jgi:hypothetical protein